MQQPSSIGKSASGCRIQSILQVKTHRPRLSMPQAPVVTFFCLFFFLLLNERFFNFSTGLGIIPNKLPPHTVPSLSPLVTACLFSLSVSLLLFCSNHEFVVKVKVSQLCPNLWNPLDCTVHGILQARILKWVAFPFSRRSFQLQGIEPRSPALQEDYLPSWATRESQEYWSG